MVVGDVVIFVEIKLMNFQCGPLLSFRLLVMILLRIMFTMIACCDLAVD